MGNEGKIKVAVFGAGITGLTAAHELAIRGFSVTVFDPEINEQVSDLTLDRGVGGIARSQFFARYQGDGPLQDRTPTTDSDDDERDHPREITALRPDSDFMVNETLVFQKGKPDFASETEATRFFDKLNEVRCRCAVVLGFRATSKQDNLFIARKTVVATRLGIPLADLEKIADWTKPDPALGDEDWVTVHVSIWIFPGEHGFRFFPSFYWHVFDTMRRTPLVHRSASESPIRTVFDNLVGVEELGFARSGKRESFALPRHPITSFELVRNYLRQIVDQLEYKLDDLKRFELSVFKYMTSCSERRATYEDRSWSDFLRLASYQEPLRTHLEHGPQMALGLRGADADARTQGNLVVQLLRDQVVKSPNCDMLLDGPTSSAWFEHWQDFLENQGVIFVRGKLKEFDGSSGPDKIGRITPRVERNGLTEKVECKYAVLALPLKETLELATNLEDAAKAAGLDLGKDNDLANLRDFVFPHKLAEELRTADPKGPLHHLSGIQFYFDTEVKFWRGHTQYLDSPWSLSSISQPQFWLRARDATDSFRGLLSVDIGDWCSPYEMPVPPAVRKAAQIAPPDKLVAWTAAAGDIARGAWAQIRDHHDQAFHARYGVRARFPRPIAYALDHHITVETPAGTTTPVRIDTAPYLVPLVGKFRKRPGRLSTSPKSQSAYRMIGPVVLAGTHMQTYTRVTSMESANESARHAVNAILDDARAACDRCDIWDPEDREFDDMAWFKELDRTLFQRGLPHFTDTLGWHEVPAKLPTSPRDVLEKP